VVPQQLTERVLIKPVQNVTQFLMIASPSCEALAIGVAKGAYKCVAVLSADLSMLITVAIIQAGLFHANPFCCGADTGTVVKAFMPERFGR
jgi:hypothetical protein